MYLVLALLVQALPQMGRVLPPPNAMDLVTWPIVAVILTAAAAVIGGTLRRGVIVDPLTATPAGPLRYRTALIVGAAGLVASFLGYFSAFGGRETMPLMPPYVTLVLLVGGVVVAAVALAPVLVDQLGRRLSGSADPLKVLAGGRLIRTARSAGRTATLLVICGMATGIGALGIAEEIQREATPVDAVFGNSFWFRVTGFGLTVAAALFTAFVAGAALMAGAADDLLDQRRQFAYLSIFGVGEAQLRRSVRHQLTSSAAPALAAGLLAGCLLYQWNSRGSRPGGPSALWTLGILIVGTGLAWLVAAAATFLLRGQVREAIDPKNLRVQ
jgi:hypothetical protein